MNKIKELVDKLNYYTKLYDEGQPQISDKEWDDMYFELVALEKETGIYLPESPTQKVNFTIISKLEKVEHDHLMLSLNKTKTIDDIVSLIKDNQYIGMCKMDGLTCSLTYRDGKLIKAETRGNGEIGENILHNALVISSIPNKINNKNEIVIDGEIICTYKNFKDFEILAIWAKNTANTDFVCLEPWNGIQKQFVIDHEKMGILSLKPHEEKTFSYTIEVID